MSYTQEFEEVFEPVAYIIKATTILSYDASGEIFTTQLVVYI